MSFDLIIPLLILWLLGTAAMKRVPMYDAFVIGAKQGLNVTVQVLPNLAAMLCAISLMEYSGLTAALCGLCAPLFTSLGLPVEIAPLVFLRPLSGSASLGMVENLMNAYGADSRIGLIACTVMGSSETIFYTICVYMSAASDRRTGYAIPCSLIGAFAGMWLASVFF